MNTRKPLRLVQYDYSLGGAYFITICVKDRSPILSEICDSAVGAGIARPKLSAIGEIVDRSVRSIPLHYENASVDNYVIMPDHVHLLLRINAEDGRAMPAPTTISGIIQQFKGVVTKQCRREIWQKSFYDHVIRNELDYLETWQYIENNPAERAEIK